MPLGGLVARQDEAYRLRSLYVYTSVMDVHGGVWRVRRVT